MPDLTALPPRISNSCLYLPYEHYYGNDSQTVSPFAASDSCSRPTLNPAAEARAVKLQSKNAGGNRQLALGRRRRLSRLLDRALSVVRSILPNPRRRLRMVGR